LESADLLRQKDEQGVKEKEGMEVVQALNLDVSEANKQEDHWKQRVNSIQMELNTMWEEITAAQVRPSFFIFIYMTSKTPNSPGKSKHAKRISPDLTAKTPCCTPNLPPSNRSTESPLKKTRRPQPSTNPFKNSEESSLSCGECSKVFQLGFRVFGPGEELGVLLRIDAVGS